MLTDKLLQHISPDLLFAVFGILCLVLPTAEAIRCKRPVKSILAGGGSGVLALMACHFWGGTLGICLPLTLLHLAVAFVLGIPGVLLMLGASALL